MALAEQVGQSDLIAGTIRISASEGFGTVVLAPALPGLRALHPGLVIELIANAGFLSPLKREVDIAVTLSAPTSPRLVVEAAHRLRIGPLRRPVVCGRARTRRERRCVALARSGRLRRRSDLCAGAALSRRDRPGSSRPAVEFIPARAARDPPERRRRGCLAVLSRRRIDEAASKRGAPHAALLDVHPSRSGGGGEDSRGANLDARTRLS